MGAARPDQNRRTEGPRGVSPGQRKRFKMDLMDNLKGLPYLRGILQFHWSVWERTSDRHNSKQSEQKNKAIIIPKGGGKLFKRENTNDDLTHIEENVYSYHSVSIRTKYYWYFWQKWENKSKADGCVLFFWETWLQKEKIQQEEDSEKALLAWSSRTAPSCRWADCDPANQRYVIPLATLWGKQVSPASSHRSGNRSCESWETCPELNRTRTLISQHPKHMSIIFPVTFQNIILQGIILYS